MKIDDFFDDVYLANSEASLPSATPFYEKDNNQKVAAVSLICFAILGMAAQRTIIAIFLLAGSGGIFYWNMFKDYDDITLRKKYHQELESGQIEIEEYVAKHGWENIRRFGFQIHRLNGSLLDKEELVQLVFSKLEKEVSLLFHKRAEDLVFQRGFLWQCFDENIFSEKDIEKLKAILERQLPKLKLVCIFENYQDLKQNGLLAGIENEKVKFLEQYWMQFAKVQQQFLHFREKIMQAFQKEKSTLTYPAPISLYQPGKPAIVMPDTKKLNIYYENLNQMKQKYMKEYQLLKDFRDEALIELQARWDALLER